MKQGLPRLVQTIAGFATRNGCKANGGEGRCGCGVAGVGWVGLVIKFDGRQRNSCQKSSENHDKSANNIQTCSFFIFHLLSHSQIMNPSR